MVDTLFAKDIKWKFKQCILNLVCMLHLTNCTDEIEELSISMSVEYEYIWQNGDTAVV